MIELKINEKEAGQRIDKFIRKYLGQAPLSFIYRLFRIKDVKLNSHPAKLNDVIKENDLVSIYVTDKQLEEFNKPKELTPEKFPYDIVYEDENILIVNKPRGLLVHGSSEEKRKTLSNAVLNYLVYKGEYNSKINGFSPAPAHRLDRNTSGLVLFAKRLNALQQLEELFKSRQGLTKTYLALVKGSVTKKFEVEVPLKKDTNSGIVRVSSPTSGGRYALTIITPRMKFDEYSLVEAELVTGMTHQIRVHLAYSNYPIVGDRKYGNFETNKLFKEKYKFENQFLHAEKIKFGKIGGVLSYLSNKEFVAPLPKLEKQIIEDLQS